jgi:DNA-binding GntR family transcriptional regulator
VILERLHTAAAQCAGIEQHDLQHRSILEVLASEYGRQLGSTHQSLEPALATRADAALLGIRPGEPVMLERRRSLDALGAPLEYGEDVYRGDRFRFVTENPAPEGYRFITSAPGVVSV